MLRIVARVSRNFALKPSNFFQIANVLLNNFGDRCLDFIKSYPAQRNPDTDYVRGFGIPPNQRTSEDLGARWNKKISRRNTAIILDIGNNASYAQYVQSLIDQASIHRDWWQTDNDMIEQLYPGLQNEFIQFLPGSIVDQRNGRR